MGLIEGGNKRIAQNTLLLYFRMLFMMVISLYTSRVILQVLGVEDYGIYSVVGLSLIHISEPTRQESISFSVLLF